MISTIIRSAGSFGLVAAISLVGSKLNAQSGLDVSGVELCPQSICDNGAVFLYSLFDSGGKVGGGYIQVDHNAELPQNPESCVDVDGGVFAFRLGRLFIRGEVVGGEICMSDNLNVFNVSTLMVTDRGFALCFIVELDHTPLTGQPPRPPVIGGELFVCPD